MKILPRIYHPDPIVLAESVCLASQASKHLISVLRLKIGDAVILFNGQGGQYLGRLSALSKGRGLSQAVVEIQQYQDIDHESPLNIHLGQAISRADKMDYVIQKSVELGVAHITPLITDRIGVKLSSERLQGKMQHWQQVIISACEQCGRNRPPILHPTVPLDEWQVEAELKLLLLPQAKQQLKDFQVPSQNIALLVGAEGGFTGQEIQDAENNEFIPLRLGPRVLRTETAALAAVAALQVVWGDFK